MGGILEFLGKAITPAAEAVGSYDQGQERQQIQNNQLGRQSLLDQMDMQLKQSQIDEAGARSNWDNRPPPLGKNVITGSDGTQYLVGDDATATPLLDKMGNAIK